MLSAATFALRASPPAFSHVSRRSCTSITACKLPPRVRISLTSNRPFLPENGILPARIRFHSWEDLKIPPFACPCRRNSDLEPSTAQKVSEGGFSVFQRWEVPWEWPTVLLTMFAVGLSFTLSGLAVGAILPYLGIEVGELSLDGKAQLLFAGQLSTTIIVLGVVFSITNKFQPLPDDILRYDFKRPFNLKDGWLLWAVVGLLLAVLAIYLLSAVLTIVNGENPERETDALVRLLPLLGSSSISTAYLLAITGILAPLLEETVFRGFLMASLTKWTPTPVSIVLSAAAFALAHLTPGEFPQLFVLGTTLGFSYAQTRNLLTPITMHALWNSGVIIILTLLQLQGYDIKELLQASS